MSKDKPNTISRSNGDNIAYDSLLVQNFRIYTGTTNLIKELLSDKGSFMFYRLQNRHYIKILMDEVFVKKFP